MATSRRARRRRPRASTPTTPRRSPPSSTSTPAPPQAPEATLDDVVAHCRARPRGGRDRPRRARRRLRRGRRPARGARGRHRLPAPVGRAGGPRLVRRATWRRWPAGTPFGSWVPPRTVRARSAHAAGPSLARIERPRRSAGLNAFSPLDVATSLAGAHHGERRRAREMTIATYITPASCSTVHDRPRLRAGSAPTSDSPTLVSLAAER